MKVRTLIAALCLLCVLTAGAERVKVACIGNSITYGYGLPDSVRPSKSYPAVLQRMLGDSYEVGNFGHSGATLMRHGHRPYMDLPEFRDALAFRPDVAVIHLGVNDTDPRDWPDYGAEFAGDYMALIDSLRAVNPDVRLIIANISPLKATHRRFRSGTWLWRLKIRDVIADIARAAGAELIDYDTPLRDRQNLLYDGVHPDATGYSLLARSAYSAITGRYGGLRLPAPYQSGMVLQRNRPLTIAGTADAGRHIALTLDGVTYRATADNRGRWSVRTAPLATGGPYTMTVSDGSETLRLTDILAGELWIAAGQSNMEFMLQQSKGGKEAIEGSADPRLRLYNMRQIARTDPGRWSSEIIERVDSLDYYLPSAWTAASPESTPAFSAVAYHFGRKLREAMPDVPVGIISCPVGGSTQASWIDINTLEAAMPEILNDWQHNDYIQPWAQGRAIENSGERHRHPYEPSYLFSSAIRPMGTLAPAGVIWYQGESDAHNTDVYEQLFRLFTESWRRQFDDPALPVYMAQLSSINRPSWPEFRDRQRRLALQLPGVKMAVTSDLGDSLDVHPTDKRPVGERLARLALHNTYGHTALTPQGPTLRSATASADGTVTIELDYADGLTTADGLAPRTFEIAAIDGFYSPAEATITPDNKITLRNMNVKNPRYVRYAWQPFTRANVVNADSLPMSTFRTEIDNAADFTTEPGLEYGVSAPFAGRIGSRLIMAGGCNFPTADPFAPGAAKKFYGGIYAADTAAAAQGGPLAWERIGSLAEPMAYGATAAVGSDALVLIGGTSADRSLTSVSLLTLDANGRAHLAPLAPLPAAIDNMAAAAIGRKVYVAGGNVDGKPSRDLYMLDLDAASPRWKKLSRMPGNARVQPAMAAGRSADGETCLYLFGGFAPRHGGKEPTLEVDGLMYTPSRDRWTSLDAPVDAAGTTVGLGGGCAATLSDGSIALAGGVNKEVFLDALTNQAPDYLEHPIGWYRFNPNVFILNPATLAMTIAATTPDAARAGAAMIAGADADLYLIGGELKPRIRSAETLCIR